MTTQPIDQPKEIISRPWWIVPTLLVAIAVIALLGYGLLVSKRDQVIDQKAPDFTLTTFEGDQITLSDLEGKPVIINFWASWCRECDKEMQILEKAHRRYKGKVVFLGIDYLDSRRKAIEYLDRFGITYASGPDLGSKISNRYRIKGVPETFFVSSDGTVEGFHMGPVTEPQLEEWIQILLDE